MQQSVIAFLLSVADHGITLAGLVLTVSPFLEKPVEKYVAKNRKRRRRDAGRYLITLVRNLKFLAIACLFIGCFQAWKEERQNTDTAINGKDGRTEAWRQFNVCNTERSVKSALLEQANGQISAQVTQLSGQQDTFNKCILAMGLKQQEPLRMTAKWAGTGIVMLANGVQSYVVVIVGETNQRVSNVNLDLKCNHEFNFQFAGIPSDTMWQSSSQQGADKTRARIVLNTPWNRETPLIVSATLPMTSTSSEVPICEFTLHQ